MKLVDLKMTKKEIKDRNKPIEASKEKYPWGLRITLNKESLQKLGLDLSSLNINDYGFLKAKVCVNELRSSKDMYDDSETLGLQIESASIDFVPGAEQAESDDLDWDTSPGKAENILDKRGLV